MVLHKSLVDLRHGSHGHVHGGVHGGEVDGIVGEGHDGGVSHSSEHWWVRLVVVDVEHWHVSIVGDWTHKEHCGGGWHVHGTVDHWVSGWAVHVVHTLVLWSCVHHGSSSGHRTVHKCLHRYVVYGYSHVSGSVHVSSRGG